MTVLVTGAARGIGAATAKKFAQAGYNVAINCRNEKSIEANGNAVAAACREYGVEAECFAADVSVMAECETMVKAVAEKFGSIDVLVNNAGITRDGLLVRMSEENFDDVISANLKSVFNMTKLVGAIMMKKRTGAIINMSSVSGVYGNGGQANYSASKAAVIGFTKSTAKELGPRGITCNAIAPGFTETDMTAVLSDEVKAKIKDSISLRRFGKTEDIAAAALFLAQHGYITGQVLLVDGGMSM